MSSIMDDIQDAFNKVGLFQKEVKVQTPVGTRTFYEDIDEDEEDEEEEEGFKQTPTHPDYSQPASLNFDGQNLGLYNNGEQVNNLDAQSGHQDFQSAQYQNIANKGPIPEGTYYANQNQRQNLTLNDVGLKIGEKLGLDLKHKSNWSGNPIAWGTKRVWLEPDTNTNTYGRSGFSIHGGLSKGSAGCIDIPWQTGKLSNYLDDCQDSVPLQVKYPENW